MTDENNIPAQDNQGPAPDPTREELINEAVANAKEATVSPPEPEKKAEPKPASDTDILAAAARNAKAARQEKKRYEQMLQDLQARDQEREAAFQTLQDDPVGYMQKHAPENWYSDATQRIMNDGNPGPEELNRTVMSEITALRDELKSMKEESQKRTYETQARDYLNNIDSILQSDDYAIVREDPSAVAEMNRFAQQYAETHGKYLPAEQLLKYTKQAQVERLGKLREAEFWKSTFHKDADTAPKQKASQPSAPGLGQQPARTVPPKDENLDPFDDEDRYRRAIEALKGPGE